MDAGTAVPARGDVERAAGSRAAATRAAAPCRCRCKCSRRRWTAKRMQLWQCTVSAPSSGSGRWHAISSSSDGSHAPALTLGMAGCHTAGCGPSHSACCHGSASTSVATTHFCHAQRGMAGNHSSKQRSCHAAASTCATPAACRSGNIGSSSGSHAAAPCG
jgi:hypothetical protein